MEFDRRTEFCCVFPAGQNDSAEIFMAESSIVFCVNDRNRSDGSARFLNGCK